jgi:23S rRNA pseudouridine1911/1915/1917 synthase
VSGPSRPRPEQAPTEDTAHVEIVVPPALAGVRVDRAVALVSGMSRRVVADLVAAGAVRLDDVVVTTPSRAVVGGQRLGVDVTPAPGPGPRPDPSVPFTVVHADDALVVVDKPAGVVVHHGSGHGGGTLVDGLLAAFPDLSAAFAHHEDPSRPGIVHRLDKDTSGLLVVARTPDAYQALARQFRTHHAEREYLALVEGTLETDEGVIEAPIGRSSRDPTRMAVRAGGRHARTRYRVVRRYGGPPPCTLVRVTLDTGRTHQVRVHMAAIGHPVVGDTRYAVSAREAGAPRRAGGRLFLHATRLTLDHPAGDRRTWESPLPDDLRAVLDGLGT